MACNASHADFASPAAEITTVGMFLANLRRFKLGCGLSQFGEEKSSITSEGAAARIRRNRHVRTARFRDAFQLRGESHLRHRAYREQCDGIELCPHC